MNLMHDCMFSLLKNQQLCRASYVTTGYIAHVPSLLVVKRVASTFVEVSLCFGFCVCFLADANTADRTRVSTGS